MNFEKLEVWQRASRLSANIYKYTNELRDLGFRDQLTRSGLSVPSNIAEGMTRNSDREKLRYLEISRASLSETRTQIYIGIDIGYIESKIGDSWIAETKELHAMINSLRIKIISG